MTQAHNYIHFINTIVILACIFIPSHNFIALNTLIFNPEAYFPAITSKCIFLPTVFNNYNFVLESVLINTIRPG